jgi:hypothetical protein
VTDCRACALDRTGSNRPSDASPSLPVCLHPDGAANLYWVELDACPGFLPKEGQTVRADEVRPHGTRRPVPQCRRKRWWCFTCRQSLLHTRMVFEPTPPSPYAPSAWWECPQCHREDIVFPGRELREDEALGSPPDRREPAP